MNLFKLTLNPLKIYLATLLFLLPILCFSWSLRTHLWIGQQVLNDIMEDGRIELLNQEYDIPQHVLNALQSFPGHYLMGNLGPDVYPDFIVGQTTTHPGVEGGWQTDQWLRYVLEEATDPADIAFAFGYATHAAADIFAHTYVNQYSGDIFELSDEREVELRHFVLEKYIEKLTPTIKDHRGNVVNIPNALAVNKKKLSRTFILNKKVAKQNSKVGTALHLYSMHEVYRAVSNLEKTHSDLVVGITDVLGDYLTEQLDFQSKILNGEATIKAAQLAVDSQIELLKVKAELIEEAEKAKNIAKDIVNKHPELIAFNEVLLAEQLKLSADLLSKSLEITSTATTTISKIEGEISEFVGDLGRLVCQAVTVEHKEWAIVGGSLLLGFDWGWKTVTKTICPDCANCDNLKKAIQNARNQISIVRAQAEAAEKAYKASEELKSEIRKKVNKLKEEYKKATADIASGALDLTINAAKETHRIEVRVLKEKEEALIKAEEFVEKLNEELNIVEKAIDEIKSFIQKYNLVHLVIENWKGDIENATEDYIKTSEKASDLMITNTGSPLGLYFDWLKCSGQVFLAQPEEIGQGICDITDFIQKLQDSYNQLIEELPEPLRWLLNPIGETKKLLIKEIMPELKKAQFELIAFLSDETTASFLDLLSNPENVTAAKLNEVYRTDTSRKSLLIFNEVTNQINQDLGLKDGFFDPDKFIPVKNSVVLAKLCLLNPTQLNKLIADQLDGTVSSYYGEQVYNQQDRNFCILLDVVKNIDGNHQWQAFGLPYPRRSGNHCGPRCSNFGYDYYGDPSKGFRIYVDPYLREKVFNPLFEGSMLGALNQREELQWPNYKFPECDLNMYPSTQNSKGQLLSFDNRCIMLSNVENFSSLVFDEKFENLFFEMDKSVKAPRSWTVLASFKRRANAESYSRDINKLYPDIYSEVWAPNEPNNQQWTVMLAAGTNPERANIAKNIALSRMIGNKPFVWSTRFPWKRDSENSNLKSSKELGGINTFDQYFNIEEPQRGKRAWTIAASFDGPVAAKRFKNRLDKEFKFRSEVWSPDYTDNPKWTVMVAAGTTLEKAKEAKNKLLEKKFAKEPFVWIPKYPWIIPTDN